MSEGKLRDIIPQLNKKRFYQYVVGRELTNYFQILDGVKNEDVNKIIILETYGEYYMD